MNFTRSILLLVIVLVLVSSCRRTISPEEHLARTEVRRALQQRSFAEATGLARRVLMFAPHDDGAWARLAQAQFGARDLAGLHQTLSDWPQAVPRTGAKYDEYRGDLARAEGLRPQSGVAARIAEGCANDRRMIAQELTKLALYLDASPTSPKDLGRDVLDALGTDMGGDFLGIADLALAGDVRSLGEALSRMDSSGKEAIPIIRSLQRRLLMLVPIRSRIDGGERLQAVMTSMGKSLFWKDKPMVEKMLAMWDSAGLARVSERTGTLERRLMRGDAPPAAEALGEELVAIARQARRR